MPVPRSWSPCAFLISGRRDYSPEAVDKEARDGAKWPSKFDGSERAKSRRPLRVALDTSLQTRSLVHF
jgi:hypothetical protein